MTRAVVILGSAGLLLAGHLLVGWFAIVPACMLAGALVDQTPGWRVGLITCSLVWGVFIAWNLLLAPDSTLEMARIVAGLAGGPGVMVFALSLLVTATLGAASGWLGAALRNILR